MSLGDFPKVTQQLMTQLTAETRSVWPYILGAPQRGSGVCSEAAGQPHRSCCVTLDRSTNFSGPQFSPLKIGIFFLHQDPRCHKITCLEFPTKPQPRVPFPHCHILPHPLHLSRFKGYAGQGFGKGEVTGVAQGGTRACAPARQGRGGDGAWDGEETVLEKKAGTQRGRRGAR